MAKVYFIEHKGKKILYMDFAYSKYEEVLQAVAEGRAIIDKEPPLSVLGIVDVRESPFNGDVATALKKFSADNKPYMKMSVVVGVVGAKKVIFNSVLVFTRRRNLIAMDDIEQAKDHLAGLE